ncbi:MAG: 3-dehydroquinate synthase [Coriobacteriia bacterium]|nr:3-dehydroquinate synthase [Coriobacteriia bacterium]
MNHLFITGFMGAGKSTVGQLVAAQLGWPFADTDAVIERREGATVSQVFSERGEDGFRAAEHAALESLVAQEPSVIATGGGVVLRPDNQALLKRMGTVVYLSVTPEEALARLGDAGDRPLLAGGGLAAAQSILEPRLALYRATADHVVETTGRTASEVAEEMIAVLRGSEERVVSVGTAADAYEVRVGAGLLSHVGDRIREVTGTASAALVSDATVHSLYGERVAASLRDAGVRLSEHVVPAGEPSKSWERAGMLLEEFAQGGLDRSSVVIALGGGVVGDLAGFCAATYMRGVPLFHVPTTLLAQVDSSVGGKTGVDLRAGKNLAGAFWPPQLVLADTETLQTLPAAEWTNGLVEMAKAALLQGGGALDRFEGALTPLLWREPSAVAAAVWDAVAFKASVVTSDLRESGMRECLNLGHTLGHALELVTGYGTLSHGLAVAEGMRFAARLAESVSGAAAETTARTVGLLDAVGAGEAICTDALAPLAAVLAPPAVLAAMKSDKKSREGAVRFVLVRAPGQWQTEVVSDEILLEELGRWVSRLEGREA